MIIVADLKKAVSSTFFKSAFFAKDIIHSLTSFKQVAKSTLPL
jgi:hypothetical protein